MTNYKQRAENASMQSFLNCYLRETRNFIEFEGDMEQIVWNGETPERWLKVSLANQDSAIFAAVKHWSLTGRHLFHFPILHQSSGKVISLDYVSLVSVLSKELLLNSDREDAENELMLRTILSKRTYSAI